MKNFKNHSTQSTNPTEPMSYIDFLDTRADSGLSAFDEFMGYDTLGQSMTFDEMLFTALKAHEFDQPITIDDLFEPDFLGLLTTNELQRLAIDAIFFSLRFPGVLSLVSIDSIGRPEFVVLKRR